MLEGFYHVQHINCRPLLACVTGKPSAANGKPPKIQQPYLPLLWQRAHLRASLSAPGFRFGHDVRSWQNWCRQGVRGQ